MKTETRINITEVEFKGGRRDLFSNPSELNLSGSQWIIVEADQGEHIGRTVVRYCPAHWLKEKKPRKKIKRLAGPEDLEKLKELQGKDDDAYRVCLDRIKEREMPMRLVDVENQFDGSKITFYFTAEKRLDFRDLVKDLAHHFRTRIEMRQIGVREEAKRLSGYGRCGCTLCCRTFLREFAPVTLQMARDQHLSLNPSKISGVCGRLLCCLMYERGFYVNAFQKFPSEGSEVNTEEGKAVINRVDIFHECVHCRDQDGAETTMDIEQYRRLNPEEDREGS
jgi:cell fate regulator YaaT (PSP1 superfamily)